MNELYHFGIKRRSGRYPYGSGERPYQGEKTNVVRKGVDTYWKVRNERVKIDQEAYDLVNKALSEIGKKPLNFTAQEYRKIIQNPIKAMGRDIKLDLVKISLLKNMDKESAMVALTHLNTVYRKGYGSHTRIVYQ